MHIKMAANFVVFRGSRRLSLRAEDLSIEKISMIFQVPAHSIFMTDNNNKGILPGPDGIFYPMDLVSGGHYEVHGEGESEGGPSWQGGQNRFTFRRQLSAPSASTSTPLATYRPPGPKFMQRNILIAEVVEGKPETRKSVTIRFSELECSVGCMTAKVSEAMGTEEQILLIDSHGNEIMDCEGTSGSAFWRQHARKIYAVPEDQLQRLRGSKRRKESRQENVDLHEVVDQVEEVILASQGLQEVTKTLKDLVDFAQANHRTTVSLSDTQATTVKAAFTCVICTNPMRRPIFSQCCSSLLGCGPCVEQWKADHSYCPKCRAVDFNNNTHSVVGLDEVLAALQNFF